MDSTTLVERQIEAGQVLIDQLTHDHFDVTNALWVRFWSEGNSRWYFYIVSKTVDEQGFRPAYMAFHASMQRVSPPWGAWITLSELRLIGAKDPIARSVLSIRELNPERTWIRDVRLGDRSIEEAYIYPLECIAGDERWRGILVRVYPDTDPENAYSVEFWPRELQAAVGPSGQPVRVPRAARIRVKDGHVIEYRPPEKPLSHLGQGDYERKALEAVERIAAERATS